MLAPAARYPTGRCWQVTQVPVPPASSNLQSYRLPPPNAEQLSQVNIAFQPTLATVFSRLRLSCHLFVWSCLDGRSFFSLHPHISICLCICRVQSRAGGPFFAAAGFTYRFVFFFLRQLSITSHIFPVTLSPCPTLFPFVVCKTLLLCF